MDPTLLIVVLHYHGLADTLECLTSLLCQSYRHLNIVVIDNGSDIVMKGHLAKTYPSVEVIAPAENLGWSGGNNIGIRLAIARRYDLVCLLNNDTVVPPDMVETLIRTALFLGPCILHPAIDSYGKDEEVQLDPTIPMPPDLRSTPVPGRPGLFDISTVNGSCILVHLAIFRDIGLIDERFFLLCEDADLGARAVAAGYHLFCDTTVRIQHKESRAFGGRRTPIKAYYGTRNLMLCWEKHDGIWRTFLVSGRRLAWTIWGTAEASGARPQSWWGLIRWGCSTDTFAHAVRMGLRDYLLRRFGRLNKRDENMLTVATKAV